MNLLGVDYGSSHVGLAISSGSLAEPLATVNHKSSLLLIKQIISRQHISAIVIGDSPASFILNLKKLNIPVYRTDETLSTKDAQKALFHTTKTRRKTLEHQVAAAIILQSWLDSHPPPPPHLT